MEDKLGNKLSKAQYFAVTAISITLIMWSLPYLSNTFYEQFLEAYNLTNTQVGNLMSAYGLMATPCYILGGIFADKFRPKKLVLISLVIATLAGISMAFVTNFVGLIVVYIAYGIALPGIHWSAYLKLVRAQGSNDQQGRLFGFFEVVGAAVMLLVNYGILAVMGKIVDVIGFKWVPAIYTIFLMISLIFVQFFVKEPESLTKDNEFKFKHVGKVLKEPAVWLNAIIVME